MGAMVMELGYGYGYGMEFWVVVFIMIPGNGEIDLLDGWAFLYLVLQNI